MMRSVRLSHVIVGMPLALVLWFLACSGLTVRIDNHASTAMHDVVLVHRGGEERLGAIETGSRKSVRIWPSQESNLMLRYVDEAGVTHANVIDVYFGRGYRGSIEIEVLPSGDLRTADQIFIF